MPNPSSNIELQGAIDDTPMFQTIEQEVESERTRQALKFKYFYTLNDTIAGQTSRPYFITIEQGTDFKCCQVTGSAYYYSATVPTSFPVPNSAGNAMFAARGLQVMVTDTRSGRSLTSNFVPFECLFAPGYGLTFQTPLDLKYFLYRNSKLRFDIRNTDNSSTTHQFSIVLQGYKILTP